MCAVFLDMEECVCVRREERALHGCCAGGGGLVLCWGGLVYMVLVLG